MCAMSFFDLGTSVATPSQPEVAQAAQNALAIQQQKRLAIRPQMNLRSAIEAAGARQRAQAALGLDERRLGLKRQEIGIEDRRLGLESRRADMGIQQTNYNASMVPYQIGLGAAAGAQGLYRGYRDLRQGQAQEDMLLRNMAIQEQTGRETTEATRKRVSLLGALEEMWRRQGMVPTTSMSSDLYAPQ